MQFFFMGTRSRWLAAGCCLEICCSKNMHGKVAFLLQFPRKNPKDASVEDLKNLFRKLM